MKNHKSYRKIVIAAIHVTVLLEYYELLIRFVHNLSSLRTTFSLGIVIMTA